MAAYTILTYIFPSISLKKDVISVEFPETLVIPELDELGEFTFSKHDEELQNEIVIPFWMNFKIDSINEIFDFELNFDSDDKKVSEQQIETYKSVVSYSVDGWEKILNKILDYYKKYYSDVEELDALNIEKTEDLRKSIQLNSISIHKSGVAGMSFSCIWDDEHGLGVRIDKNNDVEVGEASEAYY